jgi:cellulose 1,4-beta-cellobiosidase
MDIWEANNAATAYTPHPCNVTGVYACEGELCGNANRYAGVCDKDGCDWNHYRNGDKTYYSPGSNYTVDTSKPFTVVTQFISSDNTVNGTLTEIRRLYVQNGKVIQNSKITAASSLSQYDSITDSYCDAQKVAYGGVGSPNAFETQGALKQMGQALARGMVLALSIWDDSGSNMLWLDGLVYPTDADATAPGNSRGPCSTSSGKPADIQANYPDAAVTFSNIKRGDIGSTFKTTATERRYLKGIVRH